ncbi:MAG: TetR-like C-terminal domain-containing protein [Acidimicrobiales bacterium]
MLDAERIVAEAREMIVSGGLESLSLRRLGRRLGVSAPALYFHVDSKAALLRAVAEGEVAALAAQFAAIDEPDPLDRIRALSRAYVRYARDNPELFQVLLLAPPDLGVAPLPDGAALPATTEAFAAASGAIDEAIASGAIVSDDPLLVALTLWSGAHGVASVLQLGFGLPPELEEAMIDEITDRILAGYRG